MRVDRLRKAGWGVGLILCSVCGASAQQNEPAAGGSMGSVTGRVVAQDTQRAARFAQVMLQRKPGTGEDRGGGESYTRTDVEGTFTVGNVVPGDYYVTASAPGYIPERAMLQAGVNAGVDPAALLAQIPVVHVAAGESSPMTVTVERGASIAGKVQWEDGSPASGVTLGAVSPTGATGFGQLPGVLQGIQTAGGEGGFATTDDRGAFRISGLAPGNYLVRAQLQGPPMANAGGRATVFGPPIRVYAPGVFRRAEAKAVTLKAGEERSDIMMAIDLRALHTVSGSAASASAGQSVASGRVALVDPNDSDLQLSGSIRADGDFAVRFVPAGSYTLKVLGASTVANSGGGRGRESGGVSFQPFSQAEIVGDTDVSGVTIALTPVATQP